MYITTYYIGIDVHGILLYIFRLINYYCCVYINILYDKITNIINDAINMSFMQQCITDWSKVHTYKKAHEYYYF